MAGQLTVLVTTGTDADTPSLFALLGVLKDDAVGCHAIDIVATWDRAGSTLNQLVSSCRQLQALGLPCRVKAASVAACLEGVTGAVLVVDACLPAKALQMWRDQHLAGPPYPTVFYCDYHVGARHTVDERLVFMDDVQKARDALAAIPAVNQLAAEVAARHGAHLLLSSAKVADVLGCDVGGIGPRFMDQMLVRPVSPCRIALLVHVGNVSVFEDMKRHFHDLRASKHHYDVFACTLKGTDHDPNTIGQFFAAMPCVRQVYVIQRRNRGFDIGAYVCALQLIQKQGLGPYDCYITLHTKTDPIWRRELVEGAIARIDDKVEAMRRAPLIGIIGSRARVYESAFDKNCVNRAHLRDLCARFGILRTDVDDPERWRFAFVGGTMFLARAEVMERLAGVSLDDTLESLNDETTLDWHWYLLPQVHPDLRDLPKTPDAARDHFEREGRAQGRAGNLLAGQGRRFRDGMIEHAYERLFGVIAKELGMLVVGM